MTTSPLKNRTLIAFALPGFVVGMMAGPVNSVIPTIYAKYYGLDLAFIGTVLLVSRIFDGITDPLVGYLSDRTKTPFGRRKPWVVFGYALTILAIYKVFVPGEDVTPTYFMFWYFLLFLAWTISDIPYGAWAAELSRLYEDRTRISVFRQTVQLLGSIAFVALPLLPIFATSEMTPEVLFVIAMVVIVLLPTLAVISLTVVPEGKPLETKPAGSLLDLAKSIARNKPFWIFVAAFALYGIGMGTYSVGSFMFLDTYLGIGDKFPYIGGVSFLLPILCMPIWLFVANKFEKHQAWAFSVLVTGLLVPLTALIAPGPEAFIPLLVLTAIKLAFLAGSMVLPQAMLPDIIDYDLLKSGTNRAGSYLAFFLLLFKVNVAVGSALGLFIMDAFQYDAQVTEHSASSVFGLKLAVIYIPAVLLVTSSLFIWRSPITRRRQAIIRRRIESRHQRAIRDQSQGQSAALAGM